MEAPTLALLQPEVHAYSDWGDWYKIAAKVSVDRIDDASRALLRDKHPRDWSTAEAKALDAETIAKRISRFEARMTEEQLRNEYVFHGAIHARLSKPASLDFTSVNEFLYSQVFMTPKSDAWFGLRPTEAITGLSEDGIIGGT